MNGPYETTRRGKRKEMFTPTTFSLLHATDFADQLENTIVPALKAGFVVLSDRYIYTLMARDMLRGMNETWLKNLYGIALVPDAGHSVWWETPDLFNRTVLAFIRKH